MIFQEERDANYVDPMDIMHNYPFQFIDAKGNKEYLTHEYIRMNWSKERLLDFITEPYSRHWDPIAIRCVGYAEL